MVVPIPSVSTSSLIGVGIACAGNVLISLALTLQKLAHRQELQKYEEQHTPKRARSRSPRTHRASNGSASPSDQTSPTGHKAGAGVAGVGVKATLLSTDANESPEPILLIRDQGSTTRPAGLEIAAPPTTQHLPPLSQPKHLSNGRPSSLYERRGQSPAPIDPQDQGIGSPVIARDSAATLIPYKPSPKGDDDSSDEEDEDTDNAGNGEDGPPEGLYLKSKLWWTGLALIVTGEIGNFLSYGFAPAVVVAPLGTVALIANCIFAPAILKERFRFSELIGMGLAILGAITVVYASNDKNPRLDVNQLWTSMKQTIFLIYTAITTILILIFSLLSQLNHFGEKYIVIDLGVCALYGAYTVLCTKALSGLCSIMFFAVFGNLLAWFLLAVLIATSVMQVKYLNKALMRFQSKEVIPTQFVLFSLSAIVGSAVLYQEFRGLPTSRFVNFAFGIATTFLGVYLLTTFSESQGETDDAEAGQASDRLKTPRVRSNRLPSISENTPLLIPADGLDSSGLETYPGSAGSLGRIRLSKRISTNEFTPTLGLNSQAGFLLLATTPPPGGGFPSLGRVRSGSRSASGPSEGTASEYTTPLNRKRSHSPIHHR